VSRKSTVENVVRSAYRPRSATDRPRASTTLVATAIGTAATLATSTPATFRKKPTRHGSRRACPAASPRELAGAAACDENLARARRSDA
jgi:hypothetical protein